MATRTASVRLVTPSFSNRWPRWVLTVRSLIAERDGDLLVAVAVGHQPQRRQLARRQLHLGDALGQLGGGGRRQVGLAGQHVVDARDERGGGDVLEDVGLGARLQRAGDVLVGVVGGQHDDPRLRVDGANPADRLDAFHHRHPQIHQRDVGPVALEGLHRLAAVGGLGHDLQVGLRG